MTTFRLTLLRHGESVSNRARRFTGWQDVELSAEGRRQAQRAAAWLTAAGMDFDVGFTSHLQRASETLRIVLAAQGRDGVAVERSWRLNERHYGALQGLTWWGAALRYGPRRVVTWQRGFTALPPPLPSGDPPSAAPAAESLRDMRARLLPYWRDTIAPAVRSGRRVLVVAHRNPLCALLGLLERPEHDEFERPRIPTARPLVYELDAELRPLRRYYLPRERGA